MTSKPLHSQTHKLEDTENNRTKTMGLYKSVIHIMTHSFLVHIRQIIKYWLLYQQLQRLCFNQRKITRQSSSLSNSFHVRLFSGFILYAISFYNFHFLFLFPPKWKSIVDGDISQIPMMFAIKLFITSFLLRLYQYLIGNVLRQ